MTALVSDMLTKINRLFEAKTTVPTNEKSKQFIPKKYIPKQSNLYRETQTHIVSGRWGKLYLWTPLQVAN